MFAFPLALAILAASPAAPASSSKVDPAMTAKQKAPIPETPKKPVVDEYQGVLYNLALRITR